MFFSNRAKIENKVSILSTSLGSDPQNTIKVDQSFKTQDNHSLCFRYTRIEEQFDFFSLKVYSDFPAI